MDLKDFVIDEVLDCRLTNKDGSPVETIKFDKYSESLEDNNFKYSWKTINDMIDKFGTHKAVMYGVHHDCEKLKPIIEQLYKDNIFYLSYWKSECGWHGWSWSEDDGTMKNMADITDGITERIEEVYALILSGLGLRFDKDENDEVVLVEIKNDRNN